MSLEGEKNTDLAFDTTTLKDYGEKYATIASDLRDMAIKLDNCLEELEKTGWTTPAGTAFHKMVQTNWKDNIEKYAALLDTLKKAIDYAAGKYDKLVVDYIETTKI